MRGFLKDYLKLDLALFGIELFFVLLIAAAFLLGWAILS